MGKQASIPAPSLALELNVSRTNQPPSARAAGGIPTTPKQSELPKSDEPPGDLPDFGPPIDSTALAGDVLDVAPQLLGCILTSRMDDELVALRITEVEAYRGVGLDPGSHAFRGKTPRNSTMFEAGGHLYVYRSYGIHWCGNIVAGIEGEASGALLRAGEIVAGHDIARARRLAIGTVVRDTDLARGPGRLGTAMAFGPTLDGTEVTGSGPITLHAPIGEHPAVVVEQSTRTGVAGPGSVHPYRFYIPGDPTVSPHRPVRPKADR